MPNYTPIELPVILDARNCKIDGVRWVKKGVHINVKVKGGIAIRVAAKDCFAIRHMDSVPVLDPETTPHSGIVPGHLLYEMHDSWLLQQTMSTEHSAYASLKHYRVIALYESVDIIAASPPVVTELHI